MSYACRQLAAAREGPGICCMFGGLKSGDAIAAQDVMVDVIATECLAPKPISGNCSETTKAGVPWQCCRTVPALQLQLLGLWAPFLTDCLASVITRCRYTMLMIALLFICRCDLWVRGLLLLWPLLISTYKMKSRLGHKMLTGCLYLKFTNI